MLLIRASAHRLARESFVQNIHLRGWLAVRAGNSPSSEDCHPYPSSSWGRPAPAVAYLSKRREETDVGYRRQRPVSSELPLILSVVLIPVQLQRQFPVMLLSAQGLTFDFPPTSVLYLITLDRWRQEREWSPCLCFLVVPLRMRRKRGREIPCRRAHVRL